MTKTFGTWLKAQQHRDDNVGDLAQDFIRDIRRTAYRRPSDWTPSKLFNRMKASNASAIALCAWRTAKREWEASR